MRNIYLHKKMQLKFSLKNDELIFDEASDTIPMVGTVAKLNGINYKILEVTKQEEVYEVTVEPTQLGFFDQPSIKPKE